MISPNYSACEQCTVSLKIDGDYRHRYGLSDMPGNSTRTAEQIHKPVASSDLTKQRSAQPIRSSNASFEPMYFMTLVP